MTEALTYLQKRFDTTCRLLFGSEVGKLEDFRQWLLELGEPLVHRDSSVSGKPITYAITNYSPSSKWIGFDEVDFQGKAEPVSLDGIGSIEGLVGKLQSRFYYVGSAVLGNSKFVEKSSGITDCFYMHETGKLTECKYVAYCLLGRLGEDCFGINGIGETAFSMKCCETFRNKRCFELWQSRSCSDCYYSHNLDDCQECFFCFNAKNLRYAIGNLELTKEGYFAVKKRLQKEMAEGLRKNKRLPSLMDIVAKCAKPKAPRLSAAEKGEKGDKKVIEDAFAKTCSLLLGSRLPGGIDDYANWLKRKIRRSETLQSAASAKPVLRFDYCRYFELPKDRLLTNAEAREAGEKLKVSEEEAESLTLAGAHTFISGIAFFCSEYRDGSNLNMVECATCGDSAHCYRSSPVVFSKYAGYSFWPRSSEHAFGCAALLSSEFCINCANSVKLSRSFECDFCRECSGIYFCHNCENVHDSMFCFNAKNLKYAIGNYEVGREKYMALKAQLLSLLRDELSKTGSLRYDIYNMGAKGRN